MYYTRHYAYHCFWHTYIFNILFKFVPFNSVIVPNLLSCYSSNQSPVVGWSFWRASVDDAGTDFDLFCKYICIVCWCFSFLWICNSILVSVQYSISGFFSIKIAGSYRSRMLRNFRQQFAWNVWMFISEILSRTSGRDCHLFQTNDSDWPALV